RRDRDSAGSVPRRAIPRRSRRSWADKLRMRRRGQPKEKPVLAANEPLLPRELVVRTALRVVAQARAVRLVGGEAVDGVDAVSDGARSLMRREVADQVCAAAGYRLPPVAGVFLKGGQLERV